jgi:hypothetical protein
MEDRIGAGNGQSTPQGQTVGIYSTRTAWMFKNMQYMRAFSKISKAKLILGRANLAFARLGYNDPLYAQRLSELNAVLLECSKARWYSSTGIFSKSKEDWKKALSEFDKCIKHGEVLLKLLESGSGEALGIRMPELSNAGTEILFADGAPVVPEVCPVIVLKGSSYEMGYQYAQQLVHVFGSWMLERKAGRRFTDRAREIIGKWEEQIAAYAPEILDMCRGWAQGAKDLGIGMTYLDVLELWTGHMPPRTTYMGRGDKISDIPPPIACSGAGAWGRATADGKLVTGSSGDADPSFPVVIMAFPDTGNNFMFTTFSGVGDITLAGSQQMFGFPGMNDKGLAYIEHGGQPRLIEPKKYWGYGLRRATSVLHILRFAGSAKEAMRMEMECPVGDAGMDNGTIGGFYADSTYGYVLESRKDPVIVRESGYMGETDFLYANNSAMHRDAAQAAWMQADQEKSKDWKWEEHGGWYPANFSGFKLSELFRGGEGQAYVALRGMYHGCFKRNTYHYNVLNGAVGKIDAEYMKMIYRNSGSIPAKPWKEAEKEFNKTGKWGRVSVGSANNGVITVTKPDAGSNGLYCVCVGEAKRGMTPNSPFLASFNIPMYNETNSFWDLQLSVAPRQAAEYACGKAKEHLKEAAGLLAGNQTIDSADTLGYLQGLINETGENLQRGEDCMASAVNLPEKESVYHWARAIRAFTRAQAKASAVTNMIRPEPSSPEELLRGR